MILLDTCVVSEAIRPLPSPNVLAWIDSLPEDRVFLSSLVIGELQKGSALLIWLEQLRERFRDRILPFDEETALRWGILTADLEKAGEHFIFLRIVLAPVILYMKLFYQFTGL